MYKRKEVEAAILASARAREKPGTSAAIALLTFDRGQQKAILHALPSELDVEVLTVDACQGSEFNYVALSTVRRNPHKTLGFVKDQQRICVAISRARIKLIIVGHANTRSGNGDWRAVKKLVA